MGKPVVCVAGGMSDEERKRLWHLCSPLSVVECLRYEPAENTTFVDFKDGVEFFAHPWQPREGWPSIYAVIRAVHEVFPDRDVHYHGASLSPVLRGRNNKIDNDVLERVWEAWFQ